MTPEELRDAVQEALDWHAIRERRTQFAAAALTGILAGHDHSRFSVGIGVIEDEAAKRADALIAALDGAVPRAPEKDARAARALHRIAFETFGPAEADADHVLDLITRFAREEYETAKP